jgi:hypothetical protein
MSRPFPWWMVLALAAWAFLLFTRLGHYALWDDESLVALSAKAVQATGDTSVLLDHDNIVAYRDGLCVHDFADRSTPPLSAYLTAASFDCLGISAFTARLPFALLGLGTGLLLLLWARDLQPPARWVLLAAMLGNVSLILFCRQCRYYSPAIFFSLAVVFVAWRWRPGARQLLILAAFSVCLFAANFMSYVALYVALGVDYLVWRRREQPLGWRGLALVLGPQIVLNGAIASVWNPFRTAFGSYEATNTLFDRLTLFGWCWRDMDRCEFFALPLLLLALGVGIYQRRTWIMRGGVALAIYVAVIALTSPQAISQSLEAEVRYLAPVLPLALALQVGGLVGLLEKRAGLLAVAAALAFGTNLFNGGSFLTWGMRSTILSYLGELSMPQAEPYTPTAAWINANVPENKSVWVTPYYATYPLMFAAPNVHYAWQLTWPARRDFTSLPPIDFAGRVSPDYIVALGPQQSVVGGIENQHLLPDFHYQLVQTIPVYWQDKYRPELYWRRFDTFSAFDPSRDGVFIYRKSTVWK